MILHGAYDLHFHFAPDFTPRPQNAYEITRDADAAGMAGLAFKDHAGSTVTVAAAVAAAFPDGPRGFGTYTLNPSVGGFNVHGLRVALTAGARIVWFPTYGAQQHIELLGRGMYQLPDDAPGLAIGDGQGGIRSDVLACVEAIAEHGAVLATGHLAPDESLTLIAEAKRRGVERMVLTHASLAVTPVPIELQRRAAELGALVEHSFMGVTPCCPGHIEMAEMARQVRAVGVEHCLLSSDFGQPANGPIVAGFARMLDGFMTHGFSAEEIRRMIVYNPRRLMGEG